MSDGTIVELARRWIGTPFHHAESFRAVGCDCLGLVRGIWRDHYSTDAPIPPVYAPDWLRDGSDEILHTALKAHLVKVDDEELKAGQVLLFRWRSEWPASHVGIATSADKMIHAHDGCGTCEVSLPAAWRRRMIARFAFPPI